MPSLTDYSWRPKYSPEHGDILTQFYIPALSCAVRYWRTTGYFQATALAIALRGIEGLIRNQGQMRLIVGCTLAPPEADAILRGHDLRATVEQTLAQAPLEPPDQAAHDALELLAWMIQHHILDIQVALPCDAHQRPLGGTALFHEKAGIIEDRAGHRIAFNGGINETLQGWTRNWDSFHVYTSWATPDHVDEEEHSFARLWSRRSSHAIVLDVPAAIRQQLLHFAPPPGQLPRRLEWQPASPETVTPIPSPTAIDATAVRPAVKGVIQNTETQNDETQTSNFKLQTLIAPRTLVWHYLHQAPTRSPEGDRVGEATCAVTPWPHQIRAFQRLWDNWPPKLLIADEVGLGKTIQAGLLLRQAWLSGRARRILILAPAAVLPQWQVELREKFNLNWPIYDGKALKWYPSPGCLGSPEKPVSRNTWHQEPCVLVSSHLIRRQERTTELLTQAAPWDLIILDEAHHARRRGGIQTGKVPRSSPNRLLHLMQHLKDRTQGLILLTATPMQVDPIEVWDLLQLLGLPAEWTAADFLRFFEITAKPAPSHEELAYLARLFRAMEHHYGPIREATVKRYAPNQNRKILRALRNAQTSIPLKQLETTEREAAIHLLQAYSPVRVLISRHTRNLLRAYHQAGKLATPIARRQVQDAFISLSPAERQVYDAVEDYIATTYNNAAAGERNAIGFVMTIYRKRLASSFYALAQTLRDRLAKLQGQPDTPSLATPENLPDDDDLEEHLDSDEAAQLETAALNREETADLKDLLQQVQALPTDTKTQTLTHLIQNLRADGYTQVIVFTQFTDTMDFLRQELVDRLGVSILCFSSRGGEVPDPAGNWRTISREETKRRFLNRQADVLLCTDAAAEGLNFQFCGALINYDMPWNPMRVEQRIGRIDRLGQEHSEIRIHNLHYRDTVETDVFQALSDRIEQFKTFVGSLQPILSLQPVLARLPGAITALVLSRREDRQQQQESLLFQLEAAASQRQPSSLDLDAITEADLLIPPRPEPAYTLSDLQAILAQPQLLPPGTRAEATGAKDFAYLIPGMAHPVRVTTDPDYYDQHCDSVELWSPGSPLFPAPDPTIASDTAPPVSRQQFLAALTPDASVPPPPRSSS